MASGQQPVGRAWLAESAGSAHRSAKRRWQHLDPNVADLAKPDPATVSSSEQLDIETILSSADYA